MNTPWVRSSAALPHEGQPVEFVLDNRNVAFEGTYTRQIFRSRWTSYDIERVRAWRIAALSADNPTQGAQDRRFEVMRDAASRPSSAHDPLPYLEGARSKWLDGHT